MDQTIGGDANNFSSPSIFIVNLLWAVVWPGPKTPVYYSSKATQPITSIRDFSKAPHLYIWTILLHHTTSCLQNIFINYEVLPVFPVHVSSKPLFYECHWLDFDSLELPWCLDIVWIISFGHCLFHDLNIGFWCGFCTKLPTHWFSHISSGLLWYTRSISDIFHHM